MAVRALTSDGFGGAKYVLSGPRALTQIEQVHTIGEAIGRPLQFQEMSREAAQQELIDAWADPSMVEGALNAWPEMVNEPEQATATGEEVTGGPARDFRDWAIDHADDFR